MRAFVIISSLALASQVFDGVSALAECPAPGLGVPCSADSDIPCGIRLVGTTSGVPDQRGEFQIVLRDLAHNPIPDADVSIDFGACATDIRIAASQPTSGVTVDCSTGVPVVHATTDANGIVRIRLVGGANHHASHDPGAAFKCAEAWARGENLGRINVSAFDEDGTGGVSPVDVSLWLTDAFAFAGVYVGRSDFDCSFTITPGDLSLLLSTSLGAASLVSATNYCQ